MGQFSIADHLCLGFSTEARLVLGRRPPWVQLPTCSSSFIELQGLELAEVEASAILLGTVDSPSKVVELAPGGLCLNELVLNLLGGSSFLALHVQQLERTSPGRYKIRSKVGFAYTSAHDRCF